MSASPFKTSTRVSERTINDPAHRNERIHSEIRIEGPAVVAGAVAVPVAGSESGGAGRTRRGNVRHGDVAGTAGRPAHQLIAGLGVELRRHQSAAL